MKKLALTLAAVSLAAIASSSAFTVIQGSVVEFTSPDDLLLDPATNLIAVNSGVAGSLVVNGVTFQGDGAADVGTASNAGVTVTTTRTTAPGAGGQIAAWQTAPTFTGGTAGSAANLSSVMHSIRWSQGHNAGDTGNQLTIDITGLNGGSLYDVQLLVSENGPTNRRWDIGVDGTIVVDDFSSMGGNGTNTGSNGFAYQGVFDPGTDGTLNIVLDDDLGGDPFSGIDGNPIIQGVIVHSVIPEPTTTALFGLGALGLALRRRRR